MIDIEPVSAVLRIGNGAPDDPWREYSASATLVWEKPGVVWIKGLSGRITRALLRELDEWLRAQGVHTIKATRAPGHKLPGFELVDDHFERRYVDN